jgi:hypothetical protein
MSGTSTGDVFIPQVAEDAVIKGMAGMRVLYGSPAVIVRPALESTGKLQVKKKVDVPYFNDIPEFLDDVPEGVGLTPDKFTMDQEQAITRRAGLRIDMSWWAQACTQTGVDPYMIISGMVVEKALRVFERRLITTARASTPNAMINDVSGAGKTLDWDVMIDTRLKFGDEETDIALLSVHSKVKGDLLKIKDSVNRPLLVESLGGGASDIPRFQGVPVKVSDLNAVDGSSNYHSLLMRRNAMVLWHSNPKIEALRDPISDTDTITCWVYYVAHQYSVLPGKTKGGVAIAKTK